MTILEWLSGVAWPLVFLTFLVLCILTVEVFSAVSRRFDPKDRTNDNIGRAALGFLSSAFIFVGAFTIITAWTENATLHAAAEHEVVVAETLLREIRLITPADSTVRLALWDYSEAVLRGETGTGGELAPSTEAEDAFVMVENAAIEVLEQPGIGTYRAEEVLDSLNDLKLAREERVGELSNKIALPLVLLLLVMAALNLAGIGLFPSGTSRGLKRTFGFVLAIAIAAMLTSVVLLESVQFIQPRLTLPVESLVSDLRGR
ncbi:MAG: hypothetical protein F2911_11585 [Actinobacteria bacterium]|uniref:Unannotated protein n=1 Tax=freshwater metagenome TaxID=449393 RepID=A0A6J7SHP8_9ZZZZ|nr:hypothetical protein [Actinomycetota bacterium]